MSSGLHEDTVAFFEARAKQGSYDSFSLEAAREMARIAGKQFAGTVSFDGTTEDIQIPSENVPGGIPVSVYKPTTLSEKPAILVYFHGGGWVLCSRENTEPLCKLIASVAKCIVLNVEYRLAPEHKFPACNDDAKTVVEWVLGNKTSVGGHLTSAVGVGGDSAGGQISATVSYEVPGLKFQILIYPKVDVRLDRPSYAEHYNDPILPVRLIEWFNEHWLLPESRGDVRANPMNQVDASKLPPALFIVAECDPLRDDSFDYAKKLKESGVKTELIMMKGLCHAFVGLVSHFRTHCERAVDSIAQFIQSNV